MSTNYEDMKGDTKQRK